MARGIGRAASTLPGGTDLKSLRGTWVIQLQFLLE